MSRKGGDRNTIPEEKFKTEVSELLLQLRRVRLARGIYLHQISEAVGATENQISHWERGVFAVKLEKLEVWADVLGFEVVLKEKETN